ncbi:hypothetical protein TrRE_jg1268 [Triparma retinervis]|uniref:Uncharacterized protein n=1 Tax=Triparma retinervis TaxID=2557542 RepID=A0A9W6ZDF3_9STRA|nr:hypothetical protein TrRE_jg1268 [Triparma retinervis]
MEDMQMEDTQMEDTQMEDSAGCTGPTDDDLTCIDTSRGGDEPTADSSAATPALSKVLLSQFRSMDSGPASTVPVTASLEIDVTEQMDVAEVYDKMVNLLHPPESQSSERSRYFVTSDYVRSSSDPSNGRSRKVRHSYLTLQPVGERSLRSALGKYGRPTLLDGGNRWRDGNGTLVDAWKGEDVESYPDVGVFRVNRFRFDDYGRVTKYGGRFRVEGELEEDVYENGYMAFYEKEDVRTGKIDKMAHK